MNDLPTLFGMLLVAIGCDWVAVTRIGAYYSDFDYHYWPLSLSRQLGLGALVGAAVFAWWMMGANKPVLVLAASAILLAIWGVTAVGDVNAQRRIGDQTVDRYSEDDY